MKARTQFLVAAIAALCSHALLSSAQLPRTGWVATASSAESGSGVASHVIDGVTGTFWHTAWTTTPVPQYPHVITLDMRVNQSVGGLQYLPRQDGNSNGNIGSYEIYLSTDGVNFGAPVTTGTWVSSSALKSATWPGASARFVRLRAVAPAIATHPWASAAEINILAPGTAPPPPPPSNSPPENPVILSRAGFTAVASSQQDSGLAAGNVLDGDGLTMWHSQWSPLVNLPHTITISFGGGTRNVAGVVILPRQDNNAGNKNGYIGQYTVEAILNGAATQVASGSFADTRGAKTVTFPARAATGIRIKALTEAGNRGQWTSIAEVNFLGYTGEIPGTQAGKFGLWSPVINMPLVPVAAALLPNGKVLTWSAFQPDRFNINPTPARTITATLDPVTLSSSVGIVVETNHDMFCPGISAFGNGDIVVTGGDNAEKTSIFRLNSSAPGGGAWFPGPNMNIPRGYQSSVTLSNGQIFVLGGSWSGGLDTKKDGEKLIPGGTWTRLPGILASQILTDDKQGIFRADNHAWLFAWSNGEVFHAGPSKQMKWFNTTAPGGVRDAGTRPGNHAMCGNSVMYNTGKIITFGGAPDYQASTATTNSVLLTLTGTTVAIKTVGPLNRARSFATGVALPDGKVLAIGGQANPQPFDDNTAAFETEIYDPATETWSILARTAVPRTYHSTAVLLQDGRVFSGGGGLCGDCATNHFDAQIFSPPYLFNADGSPATRPTITLSATTASNGNPLTVTGNTPLSKISIIRYGSSTHTVDTDHRRIELCGTTPTCASLLVSGSSSTYTVTVPSNPGFVPPGKWMVFGLNAAGVPSVSKTVTIGSTAPTAAATLQSARSVVPINPPNTADVPFFSYPLTSAGPNLHPPGLQVD